MSENRLWTVPKAYRWTLAPGESQSLSWEVSLAYLQLTTSATVTVCLNDDPECVFDVQGDYGQILNVSDCHITSIRVTNEGSETAKVQVLVGIPTVGISAHRRAVQKL